MPRRDSTFGGTWTRDTRPSTGRSKRELQDRAGFDRGPAAGASCALALLISGALWALIITAILHTTGAIA